MGTCRVPGCELAIEDMGEALCWKHAHLLHTVGTALPDGPTPHALYTPEVVDRLLATAPRPMKPVPMGTGPLEDEAQMNETTSGTIHGTTEPRVRVNLDRGQRGGYGWSITVRGDDQDAVLAALKQADQDMRDTYLAPESEA